MLWQKLHENTRTTVGFTLDPLGYHSHAPFTLPWLMRIDQQWPELLGILFTLSNSKEAGQRENAYRIFATTPGIIEKQHEDTVLSAFTRGFKDEDVTVSRHRSSELGASY
jgi:hypothetical protein